MPCFQLIVLLGFLSGFGFGFMCACVCEIFALTVVLTSSQVLNHNSSSGESFLTLHLSLPGLDFKHPSEYSSAKFRLRHACGLACTPRKQLLHWEALKRGGTTAPEMPGLAAHEDPRRRPVAF